MRSEKKFFAVGLCGHSRIVFAFACGLVDPGFEIDADLLLWE